MSEGHNAPWYSQERLAYYEGLMRLFAEKGDRHLAFTPPHTRGSLLTIAEAWILNRQKAFVPTLTDMGRWPDASPGMHPHNLSKEQSEWLRRNWGDGARQWVESLKVTILAAAHDTKKKSDYAELVMQKFRDFEHADRREFREQKSAVERAARNRL